MTWFIVIDPKAQTIHRVEAENLDAIRAQHGLDMVDFGSISRDLTAVAWEFGLLAEDPSGKPIPPQSYFIFWERLYAGTVILFGNDEQGETVDVPLHPLPGNILAHSRGGMVPLIWLEDQDQVEKAIGAGMVGRPVLQVNDKIISQWPNMRALTGREIANLMGPKR